MPEFTKAVEKQIDVEGGAPNSGDFKAICDAKTGRIFSVTSYRYSLVQHEEVYHLLRRAIDGLYSEVNEKIYETKNGARCKILVSLPEKTFKVGDDEVTPMFSVSNSYDKSRGIGVGGGGYVIACQNLSVFTAEYELSTSWKHMGHTISELRSTIQAIIDKVISLQDILEASVENRITYNEAVAFLEDLKVPKKCKEYVLEKIGGNTTAWELYNAGTEYITHHSDANIESKYNQIKKLSKILVPVVR